MAALREAASSEYIGLRLNSRGFLQPRQTYFTEFQANARVGSFGADAVQILAFAALEHDELPEILQPALLHASLLPRH